MKIMILCFICFAAVTHAFVNLGDCPSCFSGTWSIGGANALNTYGTIVTNTFGLRTSSDSSYSGTGCDFMVGVFTAGGSFGCVIHGIGSNELKYCDTYPDIPVYAYNFDARRWGTFVAVSEGCTDGLKINRLYMKNSDGEKHWGYDNKWIDSDGQTPGKFSLWQVDSDYDSGYYMEQDWFYKEPEYQWHKEGSLVCPQHCNYAGGSVDRVVICRRKKPSIHDYISYDGSECAGLDMPARSKACPAYECQWDQVFTNFNCFGNSSSNQQTTVTSAAQCQSDCANYIYAAWWDQSGTCRCYLVCSASTGDATTGVNTNTVWEQVAATGRRTN